MTAVVGVETWYQPILFHFLYRDLFTFMIIGELCALVNPKTLLHFHVAATLILVCLFPACSFTVTLPMSLYNVLK